MIHPIFSAAIKGIIEGFTEFLPISSTGHLILVRSWLPLTADPSRIQELDNLFDVIIQLPAILAIVILFWSRLWTPTRRIFSDSSSRKFWIHILAAFLPAAVIGFAVKNLLDDIMVPSVVATALVLGGIILVWIEKRNLPDAVWRAEDVSLKQALSIGFIQCLAMIPGTSRSGATIVGSRFLGLSRVAAAEFSFFLAIPTMVGAFALKFFKAIPLIQWQTDGLVFLVGSLTSFLTAWLVVALFIRFIQKHSMALFGWYRIVLGFIIFAALAVK